MLIGRRDSQTINQSQKGMRCRSKKAIRTHGGLIRRFTEEHKKHGQEGAFLPGPLA
jgi:hypothetical protein